MPHKENSLYYLGMSHPTSSVSPNIAAYGGIVPFLGKDMFVVGAGSRAPEGARCYGGDPRFTGPAREVAPFTQRKRMRSCYLSATCVKLRQSCREA